MSYVVCERVNMKTEVVNRRESGARLLALNFEASQEENLSRGLESFQSLKLSVRHVACHRLPIAAISQHNVGRNSLRHIACYSTSMLQISDGGALTLAMILPALWNYSSRQLGPQAQTTVHTAGYTNGSRCLRYRSILRYRTYAYMHVSLADESSREVCAQGQRSPAEKVHRIWSGLAVHGKYALDRCPRAPAVATCQVLECMLHAAEHYHRLVQATPRPRTHELIPQAFNGLQCEPARSRVAHVKHCIKQMAYTTARSHAGTVRLLCRLPRLDSA